MDGSGKDGGICNIFGECVFYNLCIYSFKKFIEEEFVYDFLWWVY